ncbi:hypothetical protein F7725_016379 [Dissostichus mawsoni]|uniref:Uncharacterized protein n=1 Tax=Dissostichus mawsoni TaxID=36200 RepID=A0A7J5Z1X2_DISMA|nr:hypothetical protein F7725_016379 [Dissostichus mawsoni]
MLEDMLHTQKRLSLSHSQLVMELLADHPAAGIELVGGHVGDLQQHGGHQQTLTQQLLGAARGLDVQQGIVGVFDHALPKGADAKLHHGSVVQDLHKRGREPAHLYGGVGVLDVVLQVAHQHQVAGLVPAGVQRVVVDVAEDGAGTDAVGAILGVDELAETFHDHSALLALLLVLVMVLVLVRLRRRNTTQLRHRYIRDGCVLKTSTQLFAGGKILFCHFAVSLSGFNVFFPVVDAADLLRAALGLHVVEQPVDDATDVTLILQIVHILWGKSEEESNELLGKALIQFQKV